MILAKDCASIPCSIESVVSISASPMAIAIKVKKVRRKLRKILRNASLISITRLLYARQSESQYATSLRKQRPQDGLKNLRSDANTAGKGIIHRHDGEERECDQGRQHRGHQE